MAMNDENNGIGGGEEQDAYNEADIVADAEAEPHTAEAPADDADEYSDASDEYSDDDDYTPEPDFDSESFEERYCRSRRYCRGGACRAVLHYRYGADRRI